MKHFSTMLNSLGSVSNKFYLNEILKQILYCIFVFEILLIQTQDVYNLWNVVAVLQNLITLKVNINS